MSDARPLLIRDPRFREHSGPPEHPERPARLDAIDEALASLVGHFSDLAPRPASDEEILRAHDRAYLARLAELEGRAAQLDPDTYLSARSLAVARLAAGSAIELALRVARGEAQRAFALVRPPGHHAERDAGMGFCLLNQIALAVRALQEQGIERIAVVDFDVHHGNGTQHAFEGERDVLFVSTHQYPFYPGTGSLAERGAGAGFGATVNLPLPAGCGDAEYEPTFDAIVIPVLREFRPELVLVSAGFDAHERDPMASMRVTTDGFARLTARLRAVADECCAGRMVLTLEGGYDLRGLSESVREVVRELASPHAGNSEQTHESRVSGELVSWFREAHSTSFATLRSAVSG